ncbi:MAG: 2-oxo acid dehydrogenase subunit E2 [Acidobacteria bacterium]|nr:2-oxo acid dehydrogenase subunit E2 [Acidobacteriota bacterium]
MPFPVCVPRINNNDDTVRLNGFVVQVGARVNRGDALADVETDKASFTVEAEQDGYVLALRGNPGDVVKVGSVLAWLGMHPGEQPPAEFQPGTQPTNGTAHSPAPTVKAALLLAQFGLNADSVPASSERLTVKDVEAYIAEKRLQAVSPVPPLQAASHPVLLPGTFHELSPEERGMLRTVCWHRDESVPGYVELAYDPQPFEQYAAEFQQRHKLVLSPLLALHAWRLAQAAARHKKLNSTIVDGARHQYHSVNLGFTVQSGDALFMAVVENAAEYSEKQFVDRLGELQRSAMKHSLRSSEASGATIAFTSMARWKVSRHTPVLPPYTALIAAHSTPVSGIAYLGATYDHRVLSGFEAVRALQSLLHIGTEMLQ